jgi:hypothetical protein
MTSIRPRTTRFLTAALLLVTVGCGGGGRPIGSAVGDPFSGDNMATEIRVRVRNSNFYDATITGLSDAGRRRLGTVGGNQTAVFTMPWTFTGAFRVEIDLLAGPTCTTEAISVSPGETVDIDILPDFTSSSYCR